jgi:predicted TPR repeat methyltransferase
VRPITDAPNVRIFNFIEAGLAEQAKGESVAASEDYAMVLSLDPSNKFSRFDLGILEQDAGHTGAALSLYAEALRADPNFAPARLRMANIQQARAAK